MQPQSTKSASCVSQVLRLLKVLGAGNAEASDQMSDILAQVTRTAVLKCDVEYVLVLKHNAACETAGVMHAEWHAWWQQLHGLSCLKAC